jgi:hypothetical protein
MIDMGMIVYKSSSNLAEFFLAPLLNNPALDKNNKLLASIEGYYREFDKDVRRLAEEWPDTELLFVADHGMSVRESTLNLNLQLQHLGFQVKSVKNGLKAFLWNKGKLLIPFSMRVKLRSNKHVKHSFESSFAFDSSLTKAFSMPTGDWSHGIYINDKTRFGGPVESNQINEVRAQIKRELVQHSVFIENGIKVFEKSSDCSLPEFPDLYFHLPDGMFTSNEGKEVLSKKVNSNRNIELSDFLKGKLLSGKGHYPICALTRGNWLIDDKKNVDLSSVYNHIVNKFGA